MRLVSSTTLHEAIFRFNPKTKYNYKMVIVIIIAFVFRFNLQ